MGTVDRRQTFTARHRIANIAWQLRMKIKRWKGKVTSLTSKVMSVRSDYPYLSGLYGCVLLAPTLLVVQSLDP
jgi:hypothetical protein